MIDIVYKYCDVDKWTIENLENNQLYFGEVRNFNDPYELEFDFKVSAEIYSDFLKLMYGDRYNEIVDSGKNKKEILDYTRYHLITESLKQARITCFSSVYDSIIMWGHYSNKNSGICIGYRTEDIIFNVLDKVKYSKQLPILNFNSVDDLKKLSIDKKFVSVLTTKYNGWKYENEYRLLDVSGEGKYKLIPGSIKEVYFGLFCNKEKEISIRKKLENQNVEYFRAKINTETYKLEFYRV